MTHAAPGELPLLVCGGMPGWFSLMLDTHRRSAAKRADPPVRLAQNADTLRPVVRCAGSLLRVGVSRGGCTRTAENTFYLRITAAWSYAFHGSARDGPAPRFRLAGLEVSARYALTFYDHGPTARPEESSRA